MIAILLLIFAVLLIGVGGFFGFRRGVGKEGLRAGLWLVLFVVACFAIPKMTESVLIWIAGKTGTEVMDVEQLVSALLAKSGMLKRSTYLILPGAALLRSLVVPFLMLVFYWLTGLVSLLIYLLVSKLCFSKEEKEMKLYSRLVGMVLGIIFALLGGMLTIYPVAKISVAVKEGDSTGTLQQANGWVEMAGDAYGTKPVQMLYRYTGIEGLTEFVEKKVINATVSKTTGNVWTTLPDLVGLGAAAWEVYGGISDPNTKTAFAEQCRSFAEGYFSLELLTDEQKLLLLRHLRTEAEKRIKDDTAALLISWLEVNEKEQVIGDIEAYGRILAVLADSGILEAVKQEKALFILQKEQGAEILDSMYALSNAEVVVPELLNEIYTVLLDDNALELLKTDGFVLDEKKKKEIAEVVDVMCSLTVYMENVDSLSTEQTLEALEMIQMLQDNEAVGLENYTNFLRAVMELL